MIRYRQLCLLHGELGASVSSIRTPITFERRTLTRSDWTVSQGPIGLTVTRPVVPSGLIIEPCQLPSDDAALGEHGGGSTLGWWDQFLTTTLARDRGSNAGDVKG